MDHQSAMLSILQAYRMPWVISVTWLCMASGLLGSGLFFEEAPFFYSDSDPKDPLAAFIENVDSGAITMDTSSDRAFLKDLLLKLEVPIASQVLVYSKTSFQNSRILPSRPRALYFSNDYYIGWVQGGDIEVIAVDPQLGPVFYVLEMPRPPERPRPVLIRNQECMNCHGGSRTAGVPGMLVRSVKPDTGGFPILAAGTSRTDHASPLHERWGGWYVTGEHAGKQHLGNLTYDKSDPRNPSIVRNHGKLKSLDNVINVHPYLSNESDIVALMVMEHQIMVHNLLTQSLYNTKRWLHYDGLLHPESEHPLSTSTQRLITNQVDRLLKVMLFQNELELPGWGVEGGETFQEAFMAKAKRSSEGRSLRDFNLIARLFKHRLSYMIHSAAFDHLPSVFKKPFYQKLRTILEGKDTSGEYDYLKEKERSRILAILKEHKPEALSAEKLP